MNRAVLGVLAALIALPSTVAFAADMAVKAPPAAPPPAATWTGFYVGGYFGGAWTSDKIVDVNGLNGGAHYTMNNFTGIGGAQGGFNYQISNIVFGVEAEYGSMVVHQKMFDPNFPGGTFSSIDGKSDWDVTGRLGLAYNSLLLYLKGGEVWTNMAASIDNHLGGFGGGRAYTSHYSGPAFGGGMEMMIPQTALSVKVEYLGFFFGTKNAVLMTFPVGHFAYSNRVSVDTWKVGLNYHFPATGCWFGHC